MAIKEGRIELELPCALTDEEVQSRSRMLGETVWEIDETNTARSAAMKEFKERLVCALTDEEVQSRSRMLGETVWEIDETNTARSAAMKEFKERLVGLNEQQRKLSRMIRNRVEARMVRCAVQFHTPAEGLKRVIRMDTGEMVSEG